MNKETSEVQSSLLRNKLSATAIRLQQEANPKGLNTTLTTLEKVMRNSTKVLSDFYQNLSRPGFSPRNALPDTLPDPDVYNAHFQLIYDDLAIAFAEFENLESVVLGNFNYMVSRLNRLNRKLKLISSSLGDYSLLANLNTGDAIYFADSFNNLERIEAQSPLLNNEQCEINQVEGIATLPVDRSEQNEITIAQVPVINTESNGVIGNNEEANAAVNDDITAILDNNADTWFEYERVLLEDDGEPLVLDFTVNLGIPSNMNFIRINPNNFGTRTQIEVVEIETSLDGNDFVSVKDDIPIADFLEQDEENVFTLAPSTSKYSGQGFYTFTARQAKYVRLVFRQKTPYAITTETGQKKFRYAIGIRDIEIQALPYKNLGELISKEYLSSDEIRKVVLLSNQNPHPATTSSLAGVNHFVSPDNGVTWHQIRPKISDGLANTDQEIPELLDFNGVAHNSIITPNPVFGLRYKAVLSRNTEAFSQDNPELAQILGNKTELHQVPTTTPFEFTLQKSAIPETIQILDPALGGRGNGSEYLIATGNGDKLKVRLPFKNLKKEPVKTLVGGVWSKTRIAPEKVFVNGEQWTRGALTSTNKNYRFDYKNGEIEFGDGSDGAAVPLGAKVAMQLTDERLFVTKGNPNYARTDFAFAKDKLRVNVEIVFPPEVTTTELERDATEHVLSPYVHSDASVTFSDSGVFASGVTYIDGESELVASGQYSINYEDGLLYSYTPTAKSQVTSVNYTYTPRNFLDPGTEDELGEWWFARSDVLSEAKLPKNSIVVSPRAYQTFKVTETVPAGTKYFNLSHLNIVPGSVRFYKGDGNTAPTELSQERQFINGKKELRIASRVKQKIGKWRRIDLTRKHRPAFAVTGDAFASLFARWWVPNAWLSERYIYGYWASKEQQSVWKPLVWALNPEIPDWEEYQIKFPGLAALGHQEYSVASAFFSHNNDAISASNPSEQYWKLIYRHNPDDVNDIRFFQNYYVTFHENVIPIEHDYQYIEYWRPKWDLFNNQDKLYSIHYRTGEVFLRNNTSSDVTVTYEYTNYRVQYDLSRTIKDSDWSYDETDKKITIEDREMLQYIRTYRADKEGQSFSRHYQISYEYVKQPRAVIDSIEPYFSPVLRDYALKVVTKSRLT